ncbi:hypothetical protein ES319_D05G327200v1 [Gossypium barbadense]|uniref:MATH domain-containing protein n=3 Tax=Gossypium TaxID=3633 RepID=A0A5J5RK15_GOSBA|nr:hypothetical protein ES319_D05G327200v1 [Gossypium barbadense]PPE01906.1 hypothetical protein GOBAR_DD01046 [Gossypium barbadense]TYG70838.1 hypothetical protein ES288_D05G346600v1 [Gossypium darwinii]TYH73675.1 hypothetical protein ES332_D05G345800v1 [Gossypium tomentosum]
MATTISNQTPKSNPATANEPAKVAEREETKDDEIAVTWREEEPAHYILQIQSLPFLLENLSEPHVAFEAFAACGYKWSLILYRVSENGDVYRESENGDVYLSPYLRIMDIQHLGHNGKIDALINFFVYHQEMNRYITIQDGKVKRFSANKQESGFSRLMLPPKFIDRLNLKENTCKFGVEVFVVNPEKEKGECCCSILDLHLEENPVTWLIGNFSNLSGLKCFEFRMANSKWELQLYLRGVPEVKRKYLSIYLNLKHSKEVESGNKLHVQLKLRIKSNSPSNPRGGESKYDPTKPRTGNAWFSSSQRCWGFPYFMKLADLKQTPGLIDNDHLTVEAEFSSIYVIQDLAPEPHAANSD